MSRLIDRAELFNRLANIKTLEETFAVINGMPTVDAEPVRHGEWVRGEDRHGIFYACSQCGELSPRAFLLNNWNHMEGCAAAKTKYCPNCGARIDEVSECLTLE